MANHYNIDHQQVFRKRSGFRRSYIQRRGMNGLCSELRKCKELTTEGAEIIVIYIVFKQSTQCISRKHRIVKI